MHRITEVRAGDGLTLHLTYADGATVHADVSPLLAGNPGVFAPLRERAFFEQVTAGPRGRTVTWPGELDLDVDVFRDELASPRPFPILTSTAADPPDFTSVMLREAIAASGLTQAEVAERSGLQQPNLARLLDPRYHGHTVSSLRRVADALGQDLDVRLRSRGEVWVGGVASAREGWSGSGLSAADDAANLDVRGATGSAAGFLGESPEGFGWASASGARTPQGLTHGDEYRRQSAEGTEDEGVMSKTGTQNLGIGMDFTRRRNDAAHGSSYTRADEEKGEVTGAGAREDSGDAERSDTSTSR